MAKETFSFEEAVAPAKVFSFEEALGEPAAASTPAMETEVVTSARPWQGAGAGRGGLNDPRRLDVERAPESFERPGFAEGFTKGLTESERPLGPGGVLLRAADALTGGFAQERFNKANQSVLDDKTNPALADEFAKPAMPKPKTPVLQPRTDTISPTGGVVDALAGVPANTARSLGSTVLNFGALAAELGLTIQSPEQFRAGAAKLDKAKARTGLSVSDEPLARTGTALDALIPSAKTLADYAPEGIKQLGMMAVMGSSAIIADAGARGVNQAREEGLGIVPSVLYGAGQAASEGVPEAFSAKFAIEAAKRIPLAQALRGDARAVTTAFQQTAQSMGVELGSEQVSALGNWVVDKIAADPTATPDRLVADMKEAVKATIVQGPTMLAGAKLMQAATTGLAQRPEDQAARELARELERGNLMPGTVETLNPNLSQPAITPKTLAGLTEIGAAASVDEAIIAAARATTPQAQAVDNIGRLLGDSANVSQPGNIPPVDSGAAGAGAPEPGIRMEAGVGASGAAGPALDAGGVRDQPAGGAAPLATGRGAELTPDIAETTRQIQELEGGATTGAPSNAAIAQPKTAIAKSDGEPASVWFGRRGDGYQTPEDAQSALPTRTRISPELDWRVEQMPTGRYRLAGYDTETRAPTFTVRMNPTGTATVLGNPKAIAAKLAEAGITKVLPNRDGVTVATSQAQAAAQFLGGGEAAARTDAASAAIKPVAPPAAVEAAGVNDLDGLEAALRKERDGTTSEIESGWMDGKGRRQQTAIERAVYDAVTASVLDADAAAGIVETALKEGRADLALYAAQRAARAAESMSTTPGVSESSPKYEAIKNDLVKRKQKAQADAQTLIEKAAKGAAPATAPKTGDTITIDGKPAEVVPAGVTLFRGEPATGRKETVGGARFMSPDRKVAEMYAGKDGKISEESHSFKNLLDAPNWVAAKEKLGLGKQNTMADLVNAARDAGHDGVSFSTTNGREYIVIGKNEPAAPKTGDTITIDGKPAAKVRYGRNGTPLTEGGKPFKTKAQADAFRKQYTNNMRTVKQGKGFVLRDLTAKELAAREKAAKRLAQASTSPAGVPIPAHAFIAGKGGLAQSAMADSGFDRNMKVGNRWLFAGAGKPGLTLAEAAELLAEAGYIREESEAAAADIIKRSMTSPQYTAEGWERIAEAEQAARFEDHLAAQQEAATEEDPFGPAPAFTPAEVMVVPKSAREEYAALIDAIEAAGLDVDAILEEAARITENLTQEQYSEYVRQALTDAIANSRREADRGESAVQGREDAERSGTESSSSNTGRPGDAPSEADEGLTTPTEADVLAQQDRRENADELDQRQQIDREAERQTLTAQTAPEQRRDNTGDMFGGPSVEDFQKSVERSRKPGTAPEGPDLFASEPTTDYTGAYETDLFGEPLPAPRGNDRAARPAGAGVRGDAQPASTLQDTPAPRAEYYVNTFVGSPFSREIGASRVTTPEQAAQATRYLYRSAVERFDGIVTDKDGKPLAIVGGFKGAVSQASVYPATVMGEAVRIPGAAHIWFSHNHPSGTANLSTADERLNMALSDVFKGSGIEPMGLLAIAGDRFAYVDQYGSPSSAKTIPEATTKKSIPVIERELGDGTPQDAITTPGIAKQVAAVFYKKASEPGVMLLNSQNAVAGWFPITPAMMGPLRGTGGLNAIYRAVSQSNAASAIIVHGGELDYAGIGDYSAKVTPSENIAAALAKIDVRPLDSVNVVTNKSVAEQGREVAKGPLFSRAQPFYSALSKSIEGMTPKALTGAMWKDGIKGLINKGAVKEDEVEWSGIREWLDLQTGKVSKEDVLAYLDANGVQVQEVVLGAKAKYAGYDSDIAKLRDAGFTVDRNPEDASVMAFMDENGELMDAVELESLVDNGEISQDVADAASRIENAEQGDVTGTKYSQYTLPGGERYREVLLTLPAKTLAGDPRSLDTIAREMYGRRMNDLSPTDQAGVRAKTKDDASANYKSSHWDQPNVLAHIRLNDRTDATGARVLFVEELQSDWNADARRNGVQGPPLTHDEVMRLGKLRDIERNAPQKIDAKGLRAEMDALIAKERNSKSSTPNAPFVTNTDKWLTLALKRIVTMAAQEGYARVAFVNGEQSAERYDLSKQVRSIAWTGRGNDTEKRVTITPNSGNDIEFRVLPDGTTASSSGGLAGNEFASKRLDEVVGKDVAERIMGTPYGDMRGNGLKVGGEGMKAFYDKIVPTAANKLLAKLGGGKVETVRVNQTDGFAGNERKAPAKGISSDQLGFTITPEMREKASAGLPLFRKGADQTTGLTPTQFTQALSEAFGAKVADRLQAKGVVVPLADQTKLPAHVVPFLRDGDIVFGFYDPRTNRTYAVLENLTPDMVKGLAMHEVGVHYGFEAMLGADKYKQVMKQLDLMRRSGNVAAQKAHAEAVANAARPSQVPEETLAYMVQNNPENSVIKDVIARIKAWLFREFGIGGKYLTERDLHMLARAAVQHAARTEPGGVEVPAFMRAYHGTPHAFDKFSTDKIGTGEGAQAYGWGLYFAGKKEIAEHYRTTLAARANGIKVNGVEVMAPSKPLAQTDAKERAAIFAAMAVRDGRSLESKAREIEFAVERARTRPRDLSGFQIDGGWGDADTLEGAAKILRQWSSQKIEPVDGRLYEVEIPEESEYLLWDKPLSEQHKNVKQRLKSALSNLQPYILANKGRDVLDLSQSLADMDGLSGEIVYRRMSSLVGSDMIASRILNKSGIKGIKYLDGTSRAGGDGTYNYVIFSADDVAIQNQPAFMRQNEGMANRKGEGAPTPDTSLKQGRPDAGMQERPTVRAVSGSLGEPAQSGGGAGSGVNPSTIAKAEQAAIKAANAEMETVNRRAIDKEMRSIEVNGDGADIEDIAENPKFWDAEDEQLTPEGYAEYERRNLEIAKERAGVGLIEDLSALEGKDQTAQAEAFAAYVDALGLPVRKSYSSGGSRYVEVGIGDADYKFRFADHFNTVRDTTMQPDFNVAPGRNDFTEAFDYLLRKVSEASAPTPDGAPQFSRTPQTETKAFKDWFGDSKVVDAEGKPLVVYHGTERAGFAAFDPSLQNTSSRTGATGFFFTNHRLGAETYSGTKREAEIVDDQDDAAPGNYSVYLSIRNPLIVDFEGNGWDAAPDDSGFGDQSGNEIAEYAQGAGYDGVILQNINDEGRYGQGYGWGDTTYIAFRPEQIKSALGNRGTFDPKDPDIRFSRTNAAQEPEWWQEPGESKLDKLIYEIQDGRIDLKRVQEAIKATGKDIAERFDARMAETLYPGRVARRTDVFLNTEVRPLLQAMALSKIGMDELGDYLIARHAPERNAQVAKVNPDLPDGGAGRNSQGELMTDDAAAAYLAALSPEKAKQLAALARRVDSITAGTRELLVGEGLEKPETVKAWTSAYKNYVPLFKDEAEHGHPIGTGFNVGGSASKRSTGSTKEVTNVLAHVLMQREAVITRAEKNRVGLALYGLALSHPNKNFWTVVKPGMSNTEIAAELQAMGVDPMMLGESMDAAPTIRTVDTATNQVVDRPNPMYKKMDGAITLKVAGEDRVLLFNEKDERALRLATNLKNMDGATAIDWSTGVLHEYVSKSIPKWVGVAPATRWLASVNTQYNPVFGLVNVTRDVMGGVVNLTNTPLRKRKMQVLGDVLPALKGISRDLRGGARNEWSDLFNQFQDDGGQTGFKEMFRTADDRARAIEKELQAAEGKLTVGKATHAVLDLLDDFNTALENAVRLSAYKAGLDEGMSRPAAAKLARELTVDFNRKGRTGRELGPLYAFLNASIQGTARTVQTLAGPAGAKIVAGGLAIGGLQALMLAFAGFDEDEPPEWVKTRGLIIPIGGDKRYIVIPLALGLHVIPNTGRVLTELALYGGNDAFDRMGRAIGEIAGAFNPLGGGNIFTMDGALRTVMPTVIDPFIELGFNKNFAGSEIEKRPFNEEGDNRPGFQRARESTLRSTTGQAYLGISKAINTLTGGNDFEAGAASPTPERIRYLAQTVGGGLLREMEKAVNVTTKAGQGDDIASREIPMAGRFVGQIDPDMAERARYFESSNKIKKYASSLTAAEKAGADEIAGKISKKYPEVELANTLRSAQERIRKLNKNAAETINDRDELARIDRDRFDEMKALNAEIKAMERLTRGPTLAEKIRGEDR